MPKRLFHFLILVSIIYMMILHVSGGFSFKLGGTIFLFNRASDAILLLILLVCIQFLGVHSFRDSFSYAINKIIKNQKHLFVFIISLLSLEAILGCLHVFLYGRTFAFDLDREFNLPTYYSAFHFLLNFFIIGAIIHNGKKSGFNHKGWWFIAFVFFCLSLDEVGRFHEELVPFLRRNISSLDSVFDSNKYWVLVILPFIIFTIIYFSIFMYQTLKNYPWMLAGAALALILWIIVIWLELWEGYTEHAYKFKVLAEEESEMLGTTLFLSVFLGYLKKIK
jgi:hypothetical protein